MTYVSDLEASVHEAGTVFAAFDNHKNGDYKPYLLRSDDRGASWKSIAGDLPEKGTVYAVTQDHEKAGLLFAGTEYGVFFTVDGGTKWTQLKGGIPVIAARDLEIQRRENDLVVGSFGRGILILDDYSPLREVDEAALEKEAALFPVKRTWMFIPSAPLGVPGKSFQGDGFFSAPNPPFGAVFTYYLKDDLETRAQRREDREKKAGEEDSEAPYPDWDELRAEDREEEPEIVLTVRDDRGSVVRRIAGPTKAGFHRVSWDLRFPPSNPTRLDPPRVGPFSDPPRGPMVVPGRYTVSLAKRVDGEWTELAGPQAIETVPLGLATLEAEDKADLLEFQQETARLQRAVLGAVRAGREAGTRIDHLKKAVSDTPNVDPGMRKRLSDIESRLTDLQESLSGETTRRSRNEPVSPSIVGRVQRIVGGQWTSSSAPTGTNREAYRIAAEEFGPVLADLQQLIQRDLTGVEDDLESAGGPWTPGRVPRWSPE